MQRSGRRRGRIEARGAARDCRVQAAPSRRLRKRDPERQRSEARSERPTLCLRKTPGQGGLGGAAARTPYLGPESHRRYRVLSDVLLSGDI